VPSLVRNIIAKKKVTIILYHAPKPDVLDKHLNYLAKRYNFITLERLINALYSRSWENIQDKSLIITFDDGHKENVRLLRVLKKYNVKPTIYICSQIVNTNRHYWFKVPGIRIQLLKKYPNAKRLEMLANHFDFSPTKEFPSEERQSLNLCEINLLKEFVDFQSHTLYHPVLPSCSESECWSELCNSKEDIQRFLGRSCGHFSYPNGDYTEREIELVRKAGYLSARTTDVGWNDINTNPYRLKITGVTDDASVNMMAAQLSGLTMFIRYALRGSFKGKHRNATNSNNSS
jgi:peptidoglycan/xylan/chitin deacetylase (PgdA/CDA1 family)